MNICFVTISSLEYFDIYILRKLWKTQFDHLTIENTAKVVNYFSAPKPNAVVL